MGKRHAFGLCLGMLGLLTVPHQNTRQGREAFAVTSAELRRLHAEVERLREALRDLEKEFRNTYPVYYYDEPWGHETNVPLQKAQAALKETK